MSRTARLAAAIVIMAGSSFLVTPGPAVASSTFECGDPGPHSCCVEAPECPGGEFCCFFEDTPGEPEFCGCTQAS
jgi:hypothetical protein